MSATVEVGRIVLARVAGTVYLHVSAVDPDLRRVPVGNNHGRVNGWTSRSKIFGICAAVDGVRRPGTDGTDGPRRQRYPSRPSEYADPLECTVVAEGQMVVAVGYQVGP